MDLYDTHTDEMTTEEERQEIFSDFLNEMHETVTIAGIEFSPAAILKELDPIAFDQEFANWEDGEKTEGRFTGDPEYDDEDE